MLDDSKVSASVSVGCLWISLKGLIDSLGLFVDKGALVGPVIWCTNAGLGMCFDCLVTCVCSCCFLPLENLWTVLVIL
jgi:hypothetical protein